MENYECISCGSTVSLSQRPKEENSKSFLSKNGFMNWVNYNNESCPNYSGEQFSSDSSIIKKK